MECHELPGPGISNFEVTIYFVVPEPCDAKPCKNVTMENAPT